MKSPRINGRQTLISKRTRVNPEVNLRDFSIFDSPDLLMGVPTGTRASRPP